MGILITIETPVCAIASDGVIRKLMLTPSKEHYWDHLPNKKFGDRDEAIHFIRISGITDIRCNNYTRKIRRPRS